MTNLIADAALLVGVGKTTACANLGIGLAQKGEKVLLADSRINYAKGISA